MIRNFIFLILTVSSLIWIGYAGQELINFTGNENPERLFGQDDGRVLILNRPGEIDISSTDFFLQPRLSKLYNLLKSKQHKEERMIISEKKAMIVMERNQPFDNIRIKELFQDQGLIEVSSKKFIWNEFTVERNKGVLIIYIASEKTNNTDEKWYSFDKKSSCSIVQFNHNQPVITDYYQKDELITSYTRSPFVNKASNDISDKEMFANRIPVFVSSYQFSETEYAMRQDPVFQESIANKWANLGMVFFEYKNRPFLLMDFVRGKEPDLFLDSYRDLTHESERHYKDLSLTKNFPNNPKSGFFMRIFEDHVLFAENEEALIDLEASLELGQMLSLNKSKCDIIYSQTPQKVCYREWTNDIKIAKSTYNGSALSVEVRSAAAVVTKIIETDNSVANYSLDAPGKALLVHPSLSKFYALSQTNNLFGIDADKTKFQLDLKESTKGSLRWTNSERNEVMVTGVSKLHVVKSSGEYANGFPVSIADGISKEATSFEWKGKTNYIVVGNGGFYFWLNEKGEQVSTGKTETTNLTGNPLVWTSQKRLFFGFPGDGNFAMIEADKKKLLRSFPLPIGVHVAVLSNEIVFYSIEEKGLYKYNQRGSKSKIADHANGEWIKADRRMDGSFYLKAGTSLFHYSDAGKMLSTIKTNINNIDCIGAYSKTGKGNVIGIVDGINNRLELYRTDGKKIPLENDRGQIAFGISTYNGVSKLYTISDKFVIHYVL
jgi:hypothetical protein